MLSRSSWRWKNLYSIVCFNRCKFCHVKTCQNNNESDGSLGSAPVVFWMVVDGNDIKGSMISLMNHTLSLLAWSLSCAWYAHVKSVFQCRRTWPDSKAHHAPTKLMEINRSLIARNREPHFDPKAVLKEKYTYEHKIYFKKPCPAHYVDNAPSPRRMRRINAKR